MRRANRPAVDADGYAEVTLKKIECKMVEDKRALKKGLPPDECRYEAYDFEFVVPGVAGDLTLNERAGSVINPEPIEEKYRGTVKVYNKLTSLVIATGLAKVEELETVDLDELKANLLGLAGTVYRAKLVKVDAFYRIDLSSLTPL